MYISRSNHFLWCTETFYVTNFRCHHHFRKAVYSCHGINYTKLDTGAIVGTGILYDVKTYKSKAEFEKDKNKHYADIKKFGSHKYGFMVKNAHKFRTPIPYSGKLKFFEN